MRVTDILDTVVRRTSDGEDFGKLADLIVDSANGQVIYALISERFGAENIILNRTRLGLSDGVLTADLEEGELSRFRVGDGTADDDTAMLDLSAMPPVVVGPFGHSVSPVMGAAVWNALTERAGTERPGLDRSNERWHWFGALLGLPVFDAGGELGALEDIAINPETLTCELLELRDEAGKRFSFPFSAIRTVTKGEKSIVLELSSSPPYSAARLRDDLARG